MISAVVLTPDSWREDDLDRQREIVVRSMVWLVSAVVAGVVRDVTLAVPGGLGLSDVADRSGCRLVQADVEGERLQAAVAESREERVLVLRAGFQPEGGLVEDIETFLRREARDGVALLLATPATPWQRLFPRHARIVGVLAPKALVTSKTFAAPGARGFARLARLARRRGIRLYARARPIL
jgi:hypothetical protein